MLSLKRPSFEVVKDGRIFQDNFNTITFLQLEIKLTLI